MSTSTATTTADRTLAPQELSITPIHPHIGAEISGVDLRQSLSARQQEEIKAAILKYKVVFFRDQDLTRDQHVAFARAFGNLYPHPTVKGVEGHPEIHRIAIADHDPKVYTSRFRGPAVYHTDTSWRLVPTWGVVLRGLNIPDIGGDTIWVNGELAYQNLSDELKQRLDGLHATHDFRVALQSAGKDYPIVAHPVVRTHPETGAKILWINYSLKPAILGLPKDESDALLALLLDEYKRPEYQVRFKWRTNSIAFWDNRAAVHYAIHDYGDFPRVMERVVIADELAYADY
jgi:alpha-ketoglutarate-dependent taurine dioxygenase